MSFLDRIAECNRHDSRRYAPFGIGDVEVGAVRRDHLARLSSAAELSLRPDGSLALRHDLIDPAERTAALNAATRAMCEHGVCDPWRGESYPVGLKFGEALCEIDRAGAELFGVTAYGVHLTGYVRKGAAMSVWVPRRSADRPSYPGELDNMVAGGQPAHLSVLENLVKECEEEAGIPRALAASARPVGTVRYTVDGRVGRKREVIFNFELELPPDFVPVNRDGEVGDFQLWPVERAMAVVSETTEFKFNCALVYVDFFVRHGLIGPQRRDYEEICAGLNR